MDVLYCKTQLAWAAQNMKDAQDHLNNGDCTSAADDLDFAERAIQRVRDQIDSLRKGTHG